MNRFKGLLKDLGETKNVAGDQAKLVAEMAAKLKEIKTKGRSRP